MNRYILPWYRPTMSAEWWYRIDPDLGVVVSFNLVQKPPRDNYELWLCNFYPQGNAIVVRPVGKIVGHMPELKHLLWLRVTIG